MIVQYLDEINGDLVIRGLDGRTLILNATYWLAKQNPGRSDFLYGVPQNCPSLEIPKTLFDEFYSLVEKHNSLVDNEMNPLDKRLSRLVEEGLVYERKLIKYMKFKGANLERFENLKELVS